MTSLIDILARPEFIVASVMLIVGSVVTVALAQRNTSPSRYPGGAGQAPRSPHGLPDPAATPAASARPWQWSPSPTEPRSRAFGVQTLNREGPPEALHSSSPAPSTPSPRSFRRDPEPPTPEPAPLAKPKPERLVVAERPDTTFEHVAGADEAVEEVREVKDYITDPEPFRRLGARLPKGILLYGPPGTGKTLLARALAGEANASFYSVSAASFVEMYVGLGAARVRALFEEAKKNEPAVIFIDELDGVGRRRSSGGPGVNEEREGTLNQLLIEMDGFEPGAGVLVVGATNRLDVLDPALLRSGRFDRRIPLDLPDVAGRAAILRIHAKDKPLAEDVALDAVARRTVGLSGADLANVINEAALLAARERQGKIHPRHLSEAVERVIAGPARRSRLLSPHERHRIACHEAGHAVAAAGLPAADPVGKVSIVARGQGGGFTWFLPAYDQVLVTRSQLLDRLAAMLAGKVSEELLLGEPSSGGNDDLHRASDLARQMVTRLGMNPLVNMAVASPDSDRPSVPSERLASRIDAEVEALLVEAQERSRAVLEENRPVVERLVADLLEKESLEGPDLESYLAQVGELEARRCS